MAHTYSSSVGNSTSSVAVIGSTGGDEGKAASTVFHDFLGKGSAPDSSPVVGPPAGKVRPLSEASASASVSLGASSGGGRGPVSTTSDLGSERQAGNHLEGVPFYGPRSDFISHDASNRFSGTKRSNSDSYLRTPNDTFPSVRHESLDSSQLMKLLRHSGRERPRRPHDEDSSYSMHAVRPMPAALVAQPSSVGRTDAKNSRLDRGIPMNVASVWQQPPRSNQVLPFGYPALSSKFRDSHAGPSVILQGAAADEGSRTGIKGPGILSSINASGGISEKNFSGPKASCDKQKPGIHLSELETSTTPSLKGIASSGCQMTIFYGGQAHVFDNVQPNKADIIMSLAGSNGGSWSTTYVPKPTTKKFTGESCTPSEKNRRSLGDSSALRAEVLEKMSARVNSTHELSSG
ncbi:OLC1v1030167C3 [Oldenlandia corymbosa var. corymbosa]|nr:OLC1v1030167C3 [Oldenlandia corymbosa var. corymbosa]